MRTDIFICESCGNRFEAEWDEEWPEYDDTRCPAVLGSTEEPCESNNIYVEN